MTNKEKHLIAEIEEYDLVVNTKLLHNHEYAELIADLKEQANQQHIQATHLITQFSNLLFSTY